MRAVDQKPLIAVFPYLKTSGRVRFRELDIRAATDTDDLPKPLADHIETLRRLFFLRDNTRITDFSWTFCDDSAESKAGTEFQQDLLHVQALIAFLYLTPDTLNEDTFLTDEHSTFWLLWPDRVPASLLFNNPNPNTETVGEEPVGEQFVSGYQGRLNARGWVSCWEKSRIYPPTNYMWLNLSQDLARDVEGARHYPDSTVRYFWDRERLTPYQERLLTAVAWYNRSAGQDLPEEVAVVYLAIAFECLLGLDQGPELSKRVQETVALLVGRTARVDSWVWQFYQARSEIVHTGSASRLTFRPIDDPRKRGVQDSGYRSLVVYGRHIFRVCLYALTSGARMAEEINLEPLFTTNSERLQEICRRLGQKEGPPATRIESVENLVREIESFRYASDPALTIDSLLGALRLLLKAYISAGVEESTDFLEASEQLSQAGRGDHLDSLEAVARLHDTVGKPVEGAVPSPLRSIVASLVESVWHYTFLYYFRLRKSRPDS